MSKADRIKEQIGWLKVVFGLLLASDLSLIAWLAQGFDVASQLQVIMAFVAVIALTLAIIWINHLAFKRIDQLEEL